MRRFVLQSCTIFLFQYFSYNCIEMNDPFIIPITYKGEEIEIHARFVRLGYTEQFHVNIRDIPLIIEFDEEREFRVINPEGHSDSKIDKYLLEELVATINKLRG